jgi:hypothetical protein
MSLWHCPVHGLSGPMPCCGQSSYASIEPPKLMRRLCFHCATEVSEYAGDPGKWPHIVGIDDQSGVGRTFCGACVSKAVIALLATQANPEGNAK